MCKLILDESDAKTCAPSTPRFCNAMCKRRGAQLAFFYYTRNSENVTFKHNAQRAEVTSTRCSLHATAYDKECSNISYDAFFSYSTALVCELMLHDPLDVHRWDFATDVFARSVPTTKVFRV